MSSIEPIPVEAPYGRADWKDYTNNWRELDAEWLQGRSIMRFASDAERDSKLSDATAGQIIYNNTGLDGTTGVLQMRTATTWINYKPLPLNSKSFQDNASGVKIGHATAGSKGVMLTPTNVAVDLPFITEGGVLTADSTGLSIKTGTKTVKLTTDTDSLNFDTKVSAPGIELTGTDPVLTATGKKISVGTVEATTVTVANITLSGTLAGGVLNGSSGTIGGVGLGTAALNTASASAGFISQAGYFNGSAAAAYMRFRDPSTGVNGDAQHLVTSTYVQSIGDNIYLDGHQRWRGGSTIYWYNAAGTHVAYGGIVIYSATDPGAGNYPNGTIWVS